MCAKNAALEPKSILELWIVEIVPYFRRRDKIRNANELNVSKRAPNITTGSQPPTKGNGSMAHHHLSKLVLCRCL